MEKPNEINLKDLIKNLLIEIERNDIFMRNHAERVAATCLRFSKNLGLGQLEVNQVYLAALLHDIGYIYLPSNIIQRRDLLNNDEIEIQKRHPLISEKIISKYQILKGLLPIIRHHHEWVDGSGYPDGLKENEIPLGAKVLNLVNWFDSATVARSPIKPMNIDQALAEINEKAGKRFDKELADKFLNFIKSTEYADSEAASAADQDNSTEISNTEPPSVTQNVTHISREIIQSIINKFKRDDIELPVLSRVVHEIQGIMNNPTTTVDQLASIIERDAVISVRLIAVANSVIYRGTDKVLTVRDAIPRVGVKETHSIVTTISNKSIYHTRNKQFKSVMEDLWMHSLASGYIARALSIALKCGEIEKYYFMGLIHDIGKVLLLKAFSDMHAKNNSLDIDEIMAAINEAHTSFGGAILRKWGYSETLVRIPLLHEGPDFRTDIDREILIINLASNIADNIGYGLKEDKCPDPSKIKSAKLLDADLGMIEDIGQDIKKLMEEVSHVF